jgi:hypothetical protein
MGGQALAQSLKKENIQSRFKVSGIWTLNLITMVGNFGLGDVFNVVEKEEHELSYHSNVTNEPNNTKVEVAIVC